MVIATDMGNLIGNGGVDKVTLTGVKQPNSEFIEQITLVIEGEKTRNLIKVSPPQNAGYSPTIFVGDFTGDGVDDVLLQIESGGSGAITFDYIYTFKDNNTKMLFNFDQYNKEFEYEIEYLDYYTVEAVSENNRTRYLINLSFKGKDYLDEIYTENGKLKEEIDGFVNPLSALFPIDADSDGVYELMAFQKISGRYDADSLGYFQNFLRWDRNKFRLVNQYVGIMGKEMIYTPRR
ncbi:MAG: VCBS repeat-containing protein [Oscillospiraceae bacterium]